MTNIVLSTDAMVPLANANNIITGTTRKMMMMYDGPMPDMVAFKAAMFSSTANTGIMEGTTRGLYRLSLLNAWAIARGNTLRAWCNYASGLVPQHVGPTKFRFPLSERPEEFTKVSGGNVSWFMFAVVTNAAVNPTSAVAAYFVGIGTIGGVGSNADLELLNSAVDMGNILKANDLVFNYQWS